jgi:hypothetical protein
LIGHFPHTHNQTEKKTKDDTDFKAEAHPEVEVVIVEDEAAVEVVNQEWVHEVPAQSLLKHTSTPVSTLQRAKNTC